MCRNISNGASWYGDRASTGSFIDECLGNLIVLTYDVPLLEPAYQTPATLQLFKRNSESIVNHRQIQNRWVANRLPQYLDQLRHVLHKMIKNYQTNVCLGLGT